MLVDSSENVGLGLGWFLAGLRKFRRVREEEESALPALFSWAQIYGAYDIGGPQLP